MRAISVHLAAAIAGMLAACWNVGMQGGPYEQTR